MSAAAPDNRLLLRLRRRAALVLWTETLCHAAMPAAFIIAAWLVAVIFGFGDFLLFSAAIILALASLGWEAVRIRPPCTADIDRRIERASGLKHRPLLTLQDELETESAWGATLWASHQARAAASLVGARTGWPAPLAALRDPYSLRALLWLLLVTGLVIAGPELPARFSSALALPSWPIFAAPQVNAWITPPAYTGQAPLLLSPGQDVTVLQGSRLTIVVNGSEDDISFSGAKLPTATLAANSRRADGVLTRSGILSVCPWWRRLARWHITTLPPGAPVLNLAPITLARGAPNLSWQASDPYGLASLRAALQPQGYPHALPEGVALPTTTGKGTARLDISDTPYGGLPVNVRLQAKNLAGRSAMSNAQTVTLPLMPLHDPTAQLLGNARQALALMPEQEHAIAWEAAAHGATPAQQHFLRRGCAARGAGHRDASAPCRPRSGGRPPADTDPPDRGRARLRRLPGFCPRRPGLVEGSGPRECRPEHAEPAVAGHAAGARPAYRRPRPAIPQLAGPDVTGCRQLRVSRLAQQIAADQQAGRNQQAQAELQQLAAALRALQSARPMSAAEAARAQAAAQSAQDLNQLMQKQAHLLDQTAKGNATAEQQGQLRTGLQSLGAGLQKAGIANLPGLGQAGQAMQAAQSALGRQDKGGAQSAESAAISSSAGRGGVAAQHAEGMSLDASNGGMPGAHGLGYSQNGSNDDNANPDLGFQRRNPADAIEQEIIKRDADPSLPTATHRYLHRLLTPDQ